MSRAVALLLVAFGLVAGCGSDDAPLGRCHLDGCPSGQFCVLFGDDVVGDRSVHECEPAPASCTAQVTCGCLETAAAAGEQPAEWNLEFCLDEGGCDESGTNLVLTCPGG